jgi:formylglycine-generating enzyme required for sulfatase activity
VLTTPVGFYNGINTVKKDSLSIQTKLAKSPVETFDMSGNVWEWVEDWYDETYYKNMPQDNPKGPSSGSLKVVKGGCYDSLADGVRVAERLGLLPQYSDQYTGFRIALDP